jgi:hypothetical protein
MKIVRLLCKEKLKWYQRLKAKFMLAGENNTRYYPIWWQNSIIGRNTFIVSIRNS